MLKTISIVVPVYNEKNTLERVLNAIKESKISDFKKEIIVVEDCSTDGTRELLKNMNWDNSKIFFNNKNSGKGYSVRRGLKEATGDFIIIQDADLEYNPNEYKKLIDLLISEDADIIYGSRFKNEKFIFKSYYLANTFLTWLSNIFTGFDLTDMETCYKCFTKESLNKILPYLSANRFEIEPEITAVAAKLKFKVKEVPISYNRRSYAEGKKIGWKDGVEAVIAIIKYSL